jgi:hypothetical protein
MTEAQVRKIVREELARWVREQDKANDARDEQEQKRHEQIMEEIYGNHGQG